MFEGLIVSSLLVLCCCLFAEFLPHVTDRRSGHARQRRTRKISTHILFATTFKPTTKLLQCVFFLDFFLPLDLKVQWEIKTRRLCKTTTTHWRRRPIVLYALLLDMSMVLWACHAQNSTSERLRPGECVCLCLFFQFSFCFMSLLQGYVFWYPLLSAFHNNINNRSSIQYQIFLFSCGLTLFLLPSIMLPFVMNFPLFFMQQ